MLPTVKDGNPLSASIHCWHDGSPNTTLTWFRNGVPLTGGPTRILHPNGTLELNPLIADADLTEEGVQYYCMLSNAFGSVISRTAILQLASKLTL